jgi:succinoglycan biosynthesis transport protein ExoP
LEGELGLVRETDIETERDKYVPFERAERNVMVQREILNALRARVAQQGIELEVPRTPVEIIESAEPPAENRPVSPKLMLNILLSLVLGVAAGVGLAYFIEYLDTSVKTVDDVERHLGLPVLGVIPAEGSLAGGGGAGKPPRRSLPRVAHQHAVCQQGQTRWRLRPGQRRHGRRQVHDVVQSGLCMRPDGWQGFDCGLRFAPPGAAHLPRTFEPLRADQCIDAGCGGGRGHQGHLHSELAPVAQRQAAAVLPGIAGFPEDAGPGEKPEGPLRLSCSSIRRPSSGVSDASILASEVDGVLLVVQYRKYPRNISSRARRMLDNVGSTVLGVVLNNINIMRDDYYYYYHSYYSSYDASDESKPEGEPAFPAGARKEGSF